MFLLEKVKAQRKLDRRMSIAVVGCHYDKNKLAGHFMNKEKIRKSIKTTASVIFPQKIGRPLSVR